MKIFKYKEITKRRNPNYYGDNYLDITAGFFFK
jgi:hypothetical protein